MTADLRAQLEQLRQVRRDCSEIHTGYDRLLFVVVARLVDELEHVREDLDGEIQDRSHEDDAILNVLHIRTGYLV